MEAGSAAGPPFVANTEEEEEEEELASVMLGMPPGFRFHPTDEEIIVHYLLKKSIDRRFSAVAITEVDLNKCEPWDLPNKAKTGEKEWYVFWQRDKKYPRGKRTNRATKSGYWKATGKDKEIHMKGKKKCLIGMRKTLVFYRGRAPKGENTNWVMHEFRLEGNSFHYINFSSTPEEEWVVGRVFQKKTGTRTTSSTPCAKRLAKIDSFVDHLLESPTPLSPSSSFLTHDEEHEDFLSMPTLSNYYNINPNNNPANFIINPQISHPNSVFTPHQSSSSLVYDHQYNQDYYEQNLNMCKMETFDNSSHNCVTSHQLDRSGDDINERSYKAEFGDQQLDRSCDFSFSPEISDLDSMWTS
ncbi:hypothetical protein ABFS83_10G120900 [Erythranthe nasuta]